MLTYKRCLYMSIAAACVTAVYLKYSLVEAKKKQFAEFNANYDIEKEYEGMKKAGIFKGFEI